MTENCQDLKQRHRFADYLYWSLMAAVPTSSSVKR